MRSTYKDGPVNQRRYGKVWIAKIVAWPIGKLAALEFGSNIDYDMAEIETKPNDLVRYGRRDHRGNNTDSKYAVIEHDGSLREIDARAAREHWIAGQTEGNSGDDSP